nr:putative ORF1 [Marmot picobirnavirus]
MVLDVSVTIIQLPNIQKGGSMTQNQIAYWNLQETIRANKAKERENTRSNKANEAIKTQTNTQNLSLGLGNIAETTRANRAKEFETNRANLESEAVRRRDALTNRLNAFTNATNAGTRIGELNEGIRAHQASEQIGLGNLAELQRANQAREAETNRANLTSEAETHRANVQRENAQRFSNATGYASAGSQTNQQDRNLAEQARHNVTFENETKRNNLTNQQLKAAELQQRINRDKWDIYVSLLNNVKPNLKYSVN